MIGNEEGNWRDPMKIACQATVALEVKPIAITANRVDF